LGSGGQGRVFLAERIGADGFVLPVAVKVFSPERFKTLEDYDADMSRVGQVASIVARIQHSNLINVHHFLDRDRIRIMIMEWIDGFDLRQLLTPRMYGIVKERFSRKRWQHFNTTLVTAGPLQPRFLPDAAVTVIRECLAALAALHREGIIHGDIKPSNIMLKSSGQAKIIDTGSAIQLESRDQCGSCTPAYAAPEVLAAGAWSEASDIASLGYLAIEMLIGRPLFRSDTELDHLMRAKESLAGRLSEILPSETEDDELLTSLLAQMVAKNPVDRIPNADPANIGFGAADTYRRLLTKTFPMADSQDGFRIWIEELREIEWEQ
jgi:serine/threonine-protein kinase